MVRIIDTCRMLAQCAVTAKNGGSVLEFLRNKGIDKISIYSNDSAMLSTFAMLFAEDNFPICKIISDELIWFYNTSFMQKSEPLECV